MKFYDKNGNIHNNVFQSILSDLTTKSDEIIPTTPVSEQCTDVELNGGKSIKIDYENNKIYLMDKSDNIILESELHPKLTSKVSTVIDIEAVDPRLKDPDFIDQIMTSERIKESINKFESLQINHSTLTDEQIFSEAKSLGIEAINIAMQNNNPDANKDSIVKKVMNKIFTKVNPK